MSARTNAIIESKTARNGDTKPIISSAGDAFAEKQNGDSTRLSIGRLGQIASLLVGESSLGMISKINQQLLATRDCIASTWLALAACRLSSLDTANQERYRRLVARLDIAVTIFCYCTLAYWLLRREQSLAALFVPAFITTLAVAVVWPISILPPRWQVRAYIIMLLSAVVSLLVFLGAFALVCAGTFKIDAVSGDIQLIPPDRRVLIFSQVFTELCVAFFLTAFWRALAQPLGKQEEIQITLAKLKGRLAQLKGEKSALRSARSKVRRLFGKWF